ncbi:MAG: response regulator [Campylobacterales bacterium]|nr:response regulator [Campylobacterales bacterium]
MAIPSLTSGEKNIFETIYNSISDGIIILDSLGKIIQINDTMVKILQSSKEKLLNISYENLNLNTINEDNQKISLDEHPGILGIKNPHQHFCKVLGIVREKHDVAWFESSIKEVFNQDEISYFIVTFKDISEIKRMAVIQQHNEEYLYDILNSSRSIIILSDGKEIRHTNNTLFEYFIDVRNTQEFKEKYGCVCNTFINVHRKNYITEDDVENDSWIEKITESNDYKVAVELSEFIFYFSISASKVHQENKELYVITLTDITDLETYKNTLENRIKNELEKRMDQEKLMIQQSKMAAMGEMIGAIAHQWKQPLNAISLQAQTLQFAYEDGELDETYINRYEGKIEEKIRFMTDTINDFKNFFSPNKIKTTFGIRNSIEKVLEILKPQLVKKRIHVEVSGDDISIVKNENEFKQVLINIINNAKDAIVSLMEDDPSYKGFININVAEHFDRISIVIKDNGEGIKSQKVLDNIFKPHFTTKEEGTGIGLYISKLIIEESIGGKLSCKNHQDGLEFNIEVYKETRKIEKAILVVDDDVSITDNLHRIFRHQFQTCYKAYSANEAKLLLEDIDFDVVVTDLIMPDIDGFELISYAKKVAKTPTLFIAVSSYGDDLEVREKLELINIKCFDKPIDPSKIIEYIKVQENITKQ